MSPKYLLIVVAFLVACTGQSKTSVPNPNVRDVHGNAFGGPAFGLDFPEGWEVRENVAFTNVIAIAPLKDEDPYTDSISVVLENLRGNLSARDYLEVGLPVMDRILIEFEVMGKSELNTASGLRAARLHYRHTINGTKVESVAMYIVRKKAGYVVTGVADVGHFPQYVSEFDAVFSSFELAK